MGDKKKQYGFILNIHRENLVKEFFFSMVQKWVSIALVFPFEFRVVFAFIILEILTGHKKKIVCKFSACSQKKIQYKKKKKIVVQKWVSIAFPVHTSQVLISSPFQGAQRTRPSPLVGWHWGLWRNNSKLPYLRILES